MTKPTPTKTISLYLPLDLYEQVRQLAQQDDRTVSVWIRRVLAREVSAGPAVKS